MKIMQLDQVHLAREKKNHVHNYYAKINRNRLDEDSACLTRAILSE